MHFSPHGVAALLILQLLNLVGLLGQGTFLHAQQNMSSVLMFAQARITPLSHCEWLSGVCRK